MARGQSASSQSQTRRGNNRKNKNNGTDPAASIGQQINPSIVSCLQEFEEQASKKNMEKLVLTLKKAQRSVLKYPLPLANGQECRMLEGIGPVLATRIDSWLKKNGLYKESDAPVSNNEQDDQDNDHTDTANNRKKKGKGKAQKAKKARRYVPKFKSAAWALLIALYRHYKTNKKQNAADLTKSELVSLSSHLSDTPMLPASSGGQHRKTFSYCGWTSMKSTLLEKKLVSMRRGRPQRYFLTDSGLKLARKLHLGAIQLLDNGDTGEYSDATDVEESDEEEEKDQEEESEKEETFENSQTAPESSASTAPQSVSTHDSHIYSQTPTSSLYQEGDYDVFEINSDSDNDNDILTIDFLNSQSSVTSISHTSNSQTDSPLPSSSRQQANKVSDSTLTMTYLNASYQPVASKDQAQVHIHDELGLVFLCQLLIPPEISFEDKDLEKNIIDLNNKKSHALIDRDLMKKRKQAFRSTKPSSASFEVLIWIIDEACGDSSSALLSELFTNKKSLRIYSVVDANPISPPLSSSKRRTSRENSQSKHLAVSDSQKTEQKMQSKRKRATIDTQNNEEEKEQEQDVNAIHFASFPRITVASTDTFDGNRADHHSSKKSRSSKFSDDYDLILVVDQRERANNDRSYIVERLKHIGVSVESSQLGVGDFLWIARSKDQREEYVLNFIVERKAIDDLASSIIDGRYKEQRFRLRQILEDQQAAYQERGSELCASELHVIYLIEGDFARQKRLPIKNLQSALVRLQVSDQFQVKHTTSIAQSIEYLSTMTQVLTEVLDNKGLSYCKLAISDCDDVFEPNLRQFNLYAAKSGAQQRNLSNKDVFARQLCCVNGCSPQIAQAIVDQFANNAKSFCDRVSTERGVIELAEVKIPCARFRGVNLRRVGPALSKTMASLYATSP